MWSTDLHFSNVMVSAGCKHHDAFISLHGDTFLNRYRKKETVYTYKIYTHLQEAIHVKEKCNAWCLHLLFLFYTHLYNLSGNQNGMHFEKCGRSETKCRREPAITGMTRTAGARTAAVRPCTWFRRSRAWWTAGCLSSFSSACPRSARPRPGSVS